MNVRTTKSAGIAALIAWALLFAYLGVSGLGAIYDPKALLDHNPGVTPQQWAEIMASPMQRTREAMVPIWELSRFIIPGLVLVASGFTWGWWRVRSNPTPHPDARGAAVQIQGRDDARADERER